MEKIAEESKLSDMKKNCCEFYHSIIVINNMF